jgi:hypothetical protein
VKKGKKQDRAKEPTKNKTKKRTCQINKQKKTIIIYLLGIVF